MCGIGSNLLRTQRQLTPRERVAYELIYDKIQRQGSFGSVAISWRAVIYVMVMLLRNFVTPSENLQGDPVFTLEERRQIAERNGLDQCLEVKYADTPLECANSKCIAGRSG